MVYAQPRLHPENEMHKVLWDFEAQTDHLISARRPDLLIVDNKANMPNCALCRSDSQQGKTERRQKER